MEDELQTDNGEENTLDQDQTQGDDSQESESAEGEAELAPAPDAKQDKANDGAQKAINKQHAKYQEQRRRAEALEKEKGELKEKLEKIEAEKGDVTVPPAPDPYDEDYEEKLKARDDAIALKANQDAQKKHVIEKQDENNEVAAQAETIRKNDLVKGFDSRITKLGLESGKVLAAVNVLRDYGVSGDLGEFILGHEDGPLITQYLAENPIELDELQSLPPIQAALKIESTIKLAAAEMKPQASDAPDPPDTLSGRGAGEQVSKFIKGATFE